MLTVMRKYAYSWMIRAILFLIFVVFAFWGIGGSGYFSQIRPIATVNGNKILSDEVSREADRLRKAVNQSYGSSATEILKGANLRKQALDRIIENRLIAREAQRIGVEISEETLKRTIAANRVFQVGGQFDFPTYQDVLRGADLMPEEFEEMTRVALLDDLLKQMVQKGVVISDDDARREYDRRNEKLSFDYLELSWERFVARIKPTDKDVEEFYKKNSEAFREPDRIMVQFIDYDPMVLAEKVTPSDKEIEEYYKRNAKTLFTHQEQVRARHILIGVAENANDKDKAEAKAKAETVLAQLRKGADFTKLAADYSADPGNRDTSGDLGFFSRGQMVKPFEEAAFKLKSGEISDVVETKFGYHIIKVDDHKPAGADTPEQARPKIIDALKRKAGADLAHNQMREDLAAALNGAELDKIADKRALKLVRTPFFAAGDSVAGTEHNPEVVTAAFKLEKGDVRAVSGQDIDPFLVKLIDRRPSYVPPLKDINDRVRGGLIRVKAEADARDAATDVLKKIKTPADFPKVAEAEKLRIFNTGGFERSSKKAPAIGEFPELTDAAGSIATIPGLVDRILEHTGKCYIFLLVSRTPPDGDRWKKAAPEFKEQLLQARADQAWAAFLDSLKDRAKITVDAKQLGEQSSS